MKNNSSLLIAGVILASLALARGQETVVYKKVAGRELKLFIEKPPAWKADDKRPAVVFFFGGGWVGGSPAQFLKQSEYLASRGLVGIRVEYRTLPKGDKGPPILCCADAKSALRYVRAHAAELGVDPRRIAAAGGSAGGHLAAFTGLVAGLDDPGDDLSVSCRPDALVLFNPVFNNGPGQWGYAQVGPRYQEFSPAHNITTAAPPAIVFLGDSDNLVPVSTLREFEAGMKNAGVRCDARVYPGAGHGFFNRNPHLTLTLIETDKFLASLGWLQGAPTAMAETPVQPNIIFILSDDLAQGDLGCYGQKLIQTPRLDRMAAEGTRYNQAYSGTSVCAPSRSSLLTGLHMGHCPIRANREIKPEGQMPLPAETITVAQLLKQAGYVTACTGKWGMGLFDTTGSPLKKGFDRFFGYNCQRHAHSYFPDYLYENDRRIPLDGKTYAQNLIQKATLDFIRDSKDKPFFLFYAVTLPHGNYEIDDLGPYAGKPWSKQQKTYAAMVTRLDHDIGELLDLLKELNLDERTLVMTAGDNGSSFSPDSEIGRLFDQTMGGKLRGFKRGLYEGGLRQAAIARWPGTVPAGHVSDEPWAFWDFLPTAVELSGGKLPEGLHVDGLSLAPFLKGGPAPQRDVFYWELHEGKPLQALRFGDWKAVRNGPGKPLELYDLKTDPAEAKDLAAAQPELVAKAEALIRQARMDDPNWPLSTTSKTPLNRKAKP